MKFTIPTMPQIKKAFSENQGLIIQKVATVGGAVLGLVVAAVLVRSDGFDDVDVEETTEE